jgi:thymidylate synthase (FAD)
MTERVKVLDHGHVQLIDTWGRLSVEDAAGDEALVAAARMSTGKGFLGWGYNDADGKHVPGDEKLLYFLYSNKHMSPFEMGGATFEVQAPILVLREWHRHRTQSYNEMSARYTPLPDVNFVPTVDRCVGEEATKNKQAGTHAGAQRITDRERTQQWLDRLAAVYTLAEEVYQEGLSIGIPKELARCPVPVARYSRMRASANLRNWLQFLTLRNDKNAQQEIRMYAQVVQQMLGKVFPRTVALFTAGRE